MSEFFRIFAFLFFVKMQMIGWCKKQIISLAAFLLFAQLSVLCSASPLISRDTIPCDTISCATISCDSIPCDFHFADTIYPSVSLLKYQVDVFDTSGEGTPSSFSDLYSDAPGIFTFRGNAFREAPFVGHIDGRPDTISVDWVFTTGYDGRPTNYGVWGGGTGWSGQPLYVHWPDSIVQRFRDESHALTKAFSSEEIIVGSLASRIYFIDYATGDSSRRSLPTDNIIKGTISLDPTLNGNLYVGQGIPCKRPFGALTFNLFKHARTHFFPQDRNAWRSWGAYDSSPIRVGNFLFRPGENGTLYKFLILGDTLRLHSTLRFKKPSSSKAAGMEASMAFYQNRGFVSDNHGNILCFNLVTMQPIWCYNNHDDSDGSPVLAIEEGRPYLYSACQVDKQGSAGMCYFVKLDAEDGSLVWQQTFSCRRAYFEGKTFDGGQFATPLKGLGNCDSLIFTNIVTNSKVNGKGKTGLYGDFVAISRKDGRIHYRTTLNHYAWSSPVALLNDDGEMFIFTADTKGRIYLIDALTGKILYDYKIGDNFESSPIVIDNHIILGSRGRKIYKLTIK